MHKSQVFIHLQNTSPPRNPLVPVISVSKPEIFTVYSPVKPQHKNGGCPEWSASLAASLPCADPSYFGSLFRYVVFDKQKQVAAWEHHPADSLSINEVLFWWVLIYRRFYPVLYGVDCYHFPCKVHRVHRKLDAMWISIYKKNDDWFM